MDKNKKDYLSASLLYQFLVCAILFGILFGLNYMKSDYINTIKTEFFDKLQGNDIIVLIDKQQIVTSDEEKVPQSSFSVLDDTQPPLNSNETEVALIPEISATGGSDTNIESLSDIPENVSVNNYSLNQKMFLPLEGTITSKFGARVHPISKSLSYHSGIDIAAQTGTSIKSAFDGIVTEAHYDQWNGYHIKIQHDNGVMTVYCHCEKLLVNQGAKVNMGETIATVGSTGSSTGPHLHFEFRINDICYDPQIALNEAVNGI